MNRNLFHRLKVLLLYHIGHKAAASDEIHIFNLSQGQCGYSYVEVCIYGHTTQHTYNDCIPVWKPLPSGNRYHNNELIINIDDILNGSTQANLLYTVVCVHPICDLPAVQIVTHNFQVIVPNEPPDGMCIVRQF